ncbi:hypothetical protein E1301_Tti007139 [Triplophysa tibetana]|uniref:Uncharacterized protein n=1 Tax=Triplophysa tibetana TaxID=1572043 RepID=A0A5A9PKR7_9TELE|nr:hypothetical protein E1301_Tti007139 [Triplophysa tibetana]
MALFNGDPLVSTHTVPAYAVQTARKVLSATKISLLKLLELFTLLGFERVCVHEPKRQKASENNKAEGISVRSYAATPSLDPEPAPPSLGDVINAVKAAFEQAIQISTEGSVHVALEKTAEEHVPRKTPTEQPPMSENVADHTTEEAAAVRVSEEETADLTAGEPDAHVSESNEQTDEESVQGPAQEAKLAQDTDEEPLRLIEHEMFPKERSDSEPVKTTEESSIKAVELVVEVVESVEEPEKSGGESVLLDPQVVTVGEPNTENFAKHLEMEESPVHAFTADTQYDNKHGREAGGEEVERSPGVTENAWKPQVSEMEKTVGTKRVEVTIASEDVKSEGLQEDVKMLPGVIERPESETELELTQEERNAGIVVEGVVGVVVEEQLEEEHEAEVEAEKVKTETEHQTFLGEVEVPPTGKTAPVETQQEAEVTVNTKGSMKWQEPVIKKVQATGDRAHEVNDVNEIITSRDPFENSHGEPALVNSVVDIPPTPTLGLGLKENSKASGQEAWKIGAIAAAFFLILQTAVTIVYILKCRRKPNSNVTPKKLCARGNGGLEYDATNKDTTIPIDEQIAVDDLPEYSLVQEEDVAMTTGPPHSSETNSSHDLRTSVV